MITYILQVLLFQVLFLAVYDFFLKKETFHTHNRWYLLGTPIVSFALPLIQIPTIQKAVPQEFVVMLPEIMLSPQKVIEQTELYNSINYVNVVFWIGVGLFLLIFSIKLVKIALLIKNNETVDKDSYKLVFLLNKTNAFSFFNFIFIGKNIPVAQQEKIIEHELVHSKQKHSADLLFFEFLRIAMWFNPLIYIYQQKLSLLHEFISDSEVIKTTPKKEYFNKLLSQAFQVENISFINQFYKHSFIKKRIAMMTKNKSKELKKLKYLLLLPLLASMLIYTSCNNSDVSKSYTNKKEFQTKYSYPLDKLISEIGEEKTYLDHYFGPEILDWKEIDYESLSVNEKEEIDGQGMYDFFKGKSVVQGHYTQVKFYELRSGRRVFAILIDPYRMPPTIVKSVSKKEIERLINKGELPFAIVEEVPVFPGCKGTREEKATCLNENIKKHILRNFNADLSKQLGLTKGKKKVWALFTIDKDGYVTDVKARGPHPKLQEEAIRTINKLPKMIAGRHNSKNVGVIYTVPISFNVN